MRRDAITAMTDQQLHAAMRTLVAEHHVLTAELVLHLIEVEARRLHLKRGASSMFVYCTEMLSLSEGRAYKLVGAARASRRFPLLIDALRDGRLHLSAITLLGPKLTEHNHRELITAAYGLSKRKVEELVAARFPKPDAKTSLRRAPVRNAPRQTASRPPAAPPPGDDLFAAPVAADRAAADQGAAATPAPTPALVVPRRAPQARSEPLSAERFKLTVTIGRELHDKVRYAQQLLRHRIPDGNVEEILDRALTDLITKVEKERFGLGSRRRKPKAQAPEPKADTRYILGSVRAEVATRDDLRCTYVSEDGHRCSERAMLELDHQPPRARGGTNTVEGLRLLCHGHNQYVAELQFGQRHMERARKKRTAIPGDRTNDPRPPTD